MPKKTEKLFFDVKISCVYRIFYDHEFFCPRQDHIQVSQIFLKVIGRKLTKIETIPSQKNSCFGGRGGRSDTILGDFSGNLVGGEVGVHC